MTSEIKNKIHILKSEGVGIYKIAGQLGLSVNTVKSFLRREKQRKTEIIKSGRCLTCGVLVESKDKHKKRLFCSDKCRNRWWNARLNQVKRKAYYSAICQYCGKSFQTYGNNHRKYCSRGCYANAKRKNG